MTLLLPLGLALGALVPALILLYVLKTRHQEHEVSSTFLWERLLRDLAAREPFQRLRWSVLLLLQLLALVALVLAVARPALTLTAPQPVHAVLVFDTSASMQATDVPPSRFDDARERARAVVEGLPGGSRVTVITAGRQVLVPAVNVEAWRALQVLDELKPSGGKANLQVAVDLARALAGSQSAGVSPGAVAGEAAAAPSSPIYLFTDGAAGESLDTAGVEVVLSGDSTPNVGIVQLSARSLPDDPNRHQVFVQVHNAAATPQARTLEILADGAVMESTRLTIEPDGDGSHVFEVSAGEATLVEVRLTEPDPFPLDDRAFHVLGAPSTTKVLLVSAGNQYLERVLGLLPQVELFRVQPRRFYAVDSRGFDLVVLDGYVPAALPPTSLLIVNPPATSVLPSVGEVENPRVVTWEESHPLLRYVDLRDLHVDRARVLSVPAWGEVLVQGNQGPLLLAGEWDGRRVVVVPFDLRQSNWPLTTAFPIFMANVYEYLRPPSPVLADNLRPGDPVALRPLLAADTIAVEGPSGTRELKPGGRTVLFTGTEGLGVYRVLQRAGADVLATSQFAVNLLDRQESDLRPRLNVAPSPAVAPETTLATVQREVWELLVVVALVLLVVEWWWFHRSA